MITTKTAEELWEFVLRTLKPELKDETFDLWLKPLAFSRDERGVFVLRVPNRFFSDWVKTHYQKKIEALLSECTEAPARLRFETQAEDSRPAPSLVPPPPETREDKSPRL